MAAGDPRRRPRRNYQSLGPVSAGDHVGFPLPAQARTTALGDVERLPVGPSIVVDITRIMGTIIDGVAMDDGKFGGIDALTNGIVLRLNNGVISNHWNAKTNGDLGLICFDSAYTEKAPAGENGFRFRNTYAGPSKHGVTLRLGVGEILEILVQDNLTALTDFQMMAQLYR